MTDEDVSEAVISVAKEQNSEQQHSDTFTLDCGVRVRLRPIPAAVIDEVTSRIPQPDIPKWYNEEYKREESNPSDPGYIKALEEYDRKRGSAMIDACVMFGLDLVDGLPADDKWLDRLKFMQKMGLMDLSRFDLADPIEKEYVFKRYEVATIGMIMAVQNRSSVSPEEIERARRSF